MAVNLILRRDKGSTLTHNEVDSNFAQLAAGTFDSAMIIQMIDSNYVLLRSPAGIDSALVEQMIDSDYINSKIDDFSHNVYHYIDSNSGQTQFSGLDKYNKTLAANPSMSTVYINGVLQTPDEYAFNSNGTLITLATPTDSDDIVTIVSIDGGVIGMDSASVQRLIDSDYIQARDRFRDSSFVTSIVTNTVDSSYLSGFIDSDYVSSRQSGGGLNIEFFTSTGSVTKVGDGDVFVEIAGGGGGTSGSQLQDGGNSYGRAILNNVADGSVITISAIGAAGGALTSGTGSSGGSTTIYVDSANGQRITMGGGGGAGASRGTDVTKPSVGGGATALYGTTGQNTGSSVVTTGFGRHYGANEATPSEGFGIGGNHYFGGPRDGTPGAVLLIGV